MKAEVNSEFDLPNIRSGLKTCCTALHLKRAAENQLHTCAPVAVLSDKWEIFWLFAFNRKASIYSTNIEYIRSGQYSNIVKFKFKLCHIPSLQDCCSIYLFCATNFAVHFITASTRCSEKKVPLYFRLKLSVDFYNFYTINNRNEYSTIAYHLLT